MDDHGRLILLNQVPEIGSLRLARLLEAFGSLEALFRAGEEQFRGVEGIGPVLANRLAGYCRRSELIEGERQAAQRAGCRIITRLDEEFPASLRTIHDPPLVLYRRGPWPADAQPAVAIVGSRRASFYGQQMAERLAYELALRGVTVVSGLARGIDGAAHRGALKAGGLTVAVLGCGLGTIYPPEHRALADQIAERGALFSEYPVGMEPLPQHFPQRNRLISGLSLGVIVVEATRRSGALITADCALEQGREVFAVPGKADSLTSEGTHQLLKQGARLVTSVEDVLEELRLVPLTAGPGTSHAHADGAQGHGPRLSDEERDLLAQLSPDEPLDLDTLAVKAALPAATCAAVLLGLELKRLAKQLPGKRFVLVAK
ncbi:MAG: DNA-protecting protein DprA [Candidatus Omnitrophica bacterium]|nr:DNA-protecting protein DprA [Candidatus Omnitrophota bacterium]